MTQDGELTQMDQDQLAGGRARELAGAETVLLRFVWWPAAAFQNLFLYLHHPLHFCSRELLFDGF
ncbi:MAG: hypothetical protein ACRD7E_31375 [Bryobacteraceae bacterium]